MRFLRVVYVVAIAVLLVLLVIAGVHAFYPPPPYPDYPDWSDAPPYNSTEYEDWERERQQQWEDAYAQYEEEAAVHDRNVFMVVLPLGVAFTIGGTFLRRRLDIFGAGLILGGLGTMIYATVPGDLDNILRFVGVAVALATLLFVGYQVFHALRRS